MGDVDPRSSEACGLYADGPLTAALRRAVLSSRLPAGAVRLAARFAAGGERADRFAADVAFWRGARRELRRAGLWRSVARPPAILMYHAFAPAGRGTRLVVPAARFARHLRWLARTGRTVVPLDTVVDAVREGRLLPPNLVVLTVDDGYRDAAAEAAPVLRRRGGTATLFVVTDELGGVNGWDTAELRGRPLLSGDELTALGPELSLGAHSATHPDLTSAGGEELAVEVGRDALERLLGRRIRAFAYPHGRVDDRVADAVRAACYDAALGIERGLNDPCTDPFRLRRAPVDGHRSLLAFELAVRFGDPDLPARLLGALRHLLRRRAPRRPIAG